MIRVESFRLYPRFCVSCRGPGPGVDFERSVQHDGGGDGPVYVCDKCIVTAALHMGSTPNEDQVRAELEEVRSELTAALERAEEAEGRADQAEADVATLTRVTGKKPPARRAKKEPASV